MEDYESQYEEYKQSLLQNRRLRNELREKYRGSLRAEQDYIDANGVLWKVVVLSGVCGLCLSLFWILEDRSDTGSIITRIILSIIIVACGILGVRVSSKFKKDSGEINFYAFRYNQHFNDHIQEDRRREMYKFEQDLSKTVHFMQRLANDPRNDLTEVVANFQCALRYVEELEKQYKDISSYDRFVETLKNDYWFNAEIQKDIDKYI